jgi:uncharacterized phage-associated protein
MTGSAPEYNKEKLRELILYIAAKSEGDPSFGRTKLAKILFFSDFLAYAQSGLSITGASYEKYPQGPFTKAIYEAESELERSGAANVARQFSYVYSQYRVVPLRRPNLSRFGGEEIAIVDAVIESFRDLNASALSEISHLHPGWQAARDFEEIPYNTVFLSAAPLTEDDVRRGQELADRLGLRVGV